MHLTPGQRATLARAVSKSRGAEYQELWVEAEARRLRVSELEAENAELRTELDKLNQAFDIKIGDVGRLNLAIDMAITDLESWAEQPAGSRPDWLVESALKPLRKALGDE